MLDGTPNSPLHVSCESVRAFVSTYHYVDVVIRSESSNSTSDSRDQHLLFLQLPSLLFHLSVRQCVWVSGFSAVLGQISTRRFHFSASGTLIMSSNTADLQSSEYDFVIVGGGLSGLVVATRLTENENIRVLVLEAGANRVDDLRIRCQGLAVSTYFNPDFDWCMVTEPQVRNSPIASPNFDCMHGSGTNTWRAKKAWSQWPSVGRAAGQRIGWILGNQLGHGHLPIAHWLQFLGEIGQPRLGLAAHGPLLSQVPHIY